MEKQDLIANQRDKESLSESSCIVRKTLILSEMAISNKDLLIPFLKLKIHCNDFLLKKGLLAYDEYFFNGKNPLIDWSENSEGSIRMFSSKEFIEGIISNGLKSDSDENARKSLNELIGRVIRGISVNEESLQNFNAALMECRKTGKKPVIIANHLSHMDAPVLNYVFENHVPLITLKDIRFITGSFMFYNKHVRPYARCFNSLFVYGPKDFSAVSTRLMEVSKAEGDDSLKSKRTVFELLKKLQEKTSQEFSSKDNEMMILFPYAGRAVGHENGCKEKMPPGIKQYLENEECVFLPLGFSGSGEIFSSNKEGGGDIYSNFKDINRVDVNLVFGEHFTGGQKSLQEVNETMHSVSDKAIGI
ncbi:MAG: 1-acyl-sn-glycerol-3-phosphate acyltransferase [Candidatus Gracilibacteria bacterium]|nr:1-acyl-sn-glycerol-3-phosphate acyltransferase [Candidatus Gracilibacteria bacterium]